MRTGYSYTLKTTQQTCVTVTWSCVNPPYKLVLGGTEIPEIPTNSHFSKDFRAKNQFIHAMDKLEVFKLHVYDIWCKW